MTINVATNIAIRERVRADLVLPHPTDLAGAIGIEDLTEEQLARLAKLRLFNARFLGAIKSGNLGAIEETRPRGPRPPTGAGSFRSYAARSALGFTVDNASLGPPGTPYYIREIAITGQNTAAAGVNGIAHVGLYLTADDISNTTTEPLVGRVWPDDSNPATQPGTFICSGQQSNTVVYPASTLVLDGQRFLTVNFRLAVGGVLTIAVVVLIEEVLIVGGPAAFYLPPVGRMNINPTTRPPAPRTTAPTIPRGAIIRATQGGRILAERTVAWVALDSEIKKLWFNQQVGAPPDPSVEWLR